MLLIDRRTGIKFRKTTKTFTKQQFDPFFPFLSFSFLSTPLIFPQFLSFSFQLLTRRRCEGDGIPFAIFRLNSSPIFLTFFSARSKWLPLPAHLLMSLPSDNIWSPVSHRIHRISFLTSPLPRTGAHPARPYFIISSLQPKSTMESADSSFKVVSLTNGSVG